MAARHIAAVQAARIAVGAVATLVAAVTAGILVEAATAGSRSSGILVVIRPRTRPDTICSTETTAAV